MKDFMERGDKIILIGYRCTGKSSVGKSLARKSGLPFIDTDKLVEEAAGKTIREMIEEGGWAFFRERERQAIKTLTSLEKSVIATGGGAVIDEESAAILKREGLMIWLCAGAETIMKRMLRDAATAEKRPPLSLHHDLKKEIEDTLAERTPIYRRLADLSVDTELTGIDECVGEIEEFINDLR